MKPETIIRRLEEGRLSPSNAKITMKYDKHNPHCGNCISYKAKGVVFTSNSHTKFVVNYCELGQFTVVIGGCCDHWKWKLNPKVVAT